MVFHFVLFSLLFASVDARVATRTAGVHSEPANGLSKFWHFTNRLRGRDLADDAPFPTFTAFTGRPVQLEVRMPGIFSILTEADHVLNVHVDHIMGGPKNHLFKVGFGFRYKSFNASIYFTDQIKQSMLFKQDKGLIRAFIPKIEKYVEVQVEGVVQSLFDKHAVALGGDGSVAYFPDVKHPTDPTDGPVLVLKTPLLEVTVYIETEGVPHFDLAVVMLGNATNPMHGIVGQTINWDPKDEAKKIVGAANDYAVRGLLATKCKVCQFTSIEVDELEEEDGDVGHEAMRARQGRRGRRDIEQHKQDVDSARGTYA